jgi:hypothetical protein
MTPIRTSYSPFDRFGVNNSFKRDLSVYVEDQNGNRIRLGKPAVEANKYPARNEPAQGNNLTSAINDLMRDVFGLPQDKKNADGSGDMKLEYTAPDGTKIKLDVDRPDQPKNDEKKSEDNDANCDAGKQDSKLSDFATDMSEGINDAVDKMMKDMGFDTDDAKQSDFEKYMESSIEDSMTNNLFDSLMDNLFGDVSNDDSAFSPWSPWGNTMFSPYNPYLSAKTFPASYAYAQMLGEYMLSSNRSVYNPNQKYQGGYSF